MLAKSDFCFLVTTKSIAVTFRGKTVTVSTDDKRYQKLLSALKEEKWDDVPELLQPEKVIYQMSKGKMRVENNQVFVQSEGAEFPVSARLNTTILKYMEEGLPFDPLVNFAIKLNQNPSYRSVNQLFDFIDHNNFTITENGNFIAYKGVRPDFKDCRTGTFDNSVGNIVKMPRNQVNENPEETCSHGLHCANFEYAHTYYASGDNILLYVEVDPKNVVSVPVDYNNAKMRVCEYKVLGVTEFEYKKPIWQPEEEKSYYDEDDENLYSDRIWDEDENDDHEYDDEYEEDRSVCFSSCSDKY